MSVVREFVESTKLVIVVAAGVCALPPAFAQESGSPGSEFQDCPQCPVMVVLPVGEYDMGSPPVDQGRPYHEGEFRRVIISQTFAVGKFEVTFDEWGACTADGKCPTLKDEGWGRGRRPAINVTWTEADRYTKWLSRKSGKSYRLLTEAEWEYAARAGAGNARFFGLKPDTVCTYANVYDKTAHAEYEFDWKPLPCDDGFTVTAPAGTFKPNAFGLLRARLSRCIVDQPSALVSAHGGPLQVYGSALQRPRISCRTNPPVSQRRREPAPV